MTRSLQGYPNAAAGRWFHNTAELSGELSVGDVVAVGEAGLAVGRAGWTLVPGGLNEVRVSEHGTRPLPRVGPRRGDARRTPDRFSRKEPERS
jgi:hypothetical protein